MNVALWIAQLALAAMFIMSGFTKVTMPLDKLMIQLPWVKDVPADLVRFIGLAELIGGAGVLLPSFFPVKPVLVPLAAMGLCVIMLLAAVFHITRGETEPIGINLALAGLAFFVAWGRFRKLPVTGRNA
ncbi:MAG: DoxX family protein [Bacteroidota bacterium]